MRLSENIKKIYKLRVFKYKKQQCVVSEIDLPVSNFEGACCHKHGVLCCIININLSAREKQNVLHKLICKNNKLRSYRGA